MCSVIEMSLCHLLAATLLLTPLTYAEHHMKRSIDSRQSSSDRTIPLLVANWCPDTIWPAVLSQAGNGPQNTGFQLKSGANQSLYVSSNWQGRVWGRTNCTNFSPGQRACTTGDCGGVLLKTAGQDQRTGGRVKPSQRRGAQTGPDLIEPVQHGQNSAAAHQFCRQWGAGGSGGSEGPGGSG